MVANERFGPTTECSLPIEESVVQVEESETHYSSIAEQTPVHLPGIRRSLRPAIGDSFYYPL